MFFAVLPRNLDYTKTPREWFLTLHDYYVLRRHPLIPHQERSSTLWLQGAVVAAAVHSNFAGCAFGRRAVKCMRIARG